MTKEVTIPAETLSSLKLQDGDHLTGHVSGGQVKLVIETTRPDRKTRPGVGFVEKWRGKFHNPNIDWSNDPRGQAILER